MQKKKLFRSGFVIAGLVCMSFILSGCAKKAKKKVEEREVRVTVQKIEKRNFRRQIPVQGTVDPVQFAVLSAKLGGTVEHFPVSPSGLVIRAISSWAGLFSGLPA